LDAGALVVLSGAFALWVGLSERALLYVRPGARLWLDVAGGILIILGLILVVLTLRHRARTDDADDHDGEHRHHVGRIGWLLLLPVVIAVAVGSNPLGSYAAGRQNADRTLPAGEFDLEQYLNAGSFGGQAPALRVMDFVRAAYDPETQDLLADTRVVLTGFVTEDDDVSDPHHFFLTRFSIGCCAADAIAVFVRVDLDNHHIPPADAWVEVEGTLHLEPPPEPGSVPGPPILVATDVREADQPDEVYEYPP
jgi:uncharacterized repeat protein (TIGR03943 family)